MNCFRNLILQRTLSLVILCTALLTQTQILYACESMNDGPELVCCCGDHAAAGCPMADACAMQENAQQNQCCEVSYDSLTDAATMHSASTVDSLTLLLDGPQPPPVIEFQQLLPAYLQVAPRFSFSPDELLIISSDEHTYFLTRRLRL
jgi:hypothetical protein